MRTIAKLKFWFDLGAGFYTPINFALLTLAAGKNIANAIGCSPVLLVSVMIPVGLLGLLVAGMVFDHFGLFRHYQAVLNERNEMLKDIKNK